MDDKSLFLYGEMYVEKGTTIHVSVTPIKAHHIINELIDCLERGDLPHFSVYGQLLTMADHLDTEESPDAQ